MMKKSSTTTTSSLTEEKKKEVPAGATIISRTVRTETEEIENGYLISKNYDVAYEEGKGDKKERGYCYYTKKWYTKEDPLTIKINDKALAEEFDGEDEDY